MSSGAIFSRAPACVSSAARSCDRQDFITRADCACRPFSSSQRTFIGLTTVCDPTTASRPWLLAMLSVPIASPKSHHSKIDRLFFFRRLALFADPRRLVEADELKLRRRADGEEGRAVGREQ